MSPQLANIEIRVCTSLEALRGIWESIEVHGHGYAFQSYAWLSAWFETIGRRSGVTVCAVLVEDAHGQPLMLLPLGVERRRMATRLVWLGGVLTDYQAPILAHDFAQRFDVTHFADLWSLIRGQLPPHDAVIFERQPEFIDTQENPFNSLGLVAHASRAHQVQLEGDFQSFLANKRSKKTLATERRKRKKLARLGNLTYVVAHEATDIERIITATIRQKSDNYRELGIIDLFADEPHRDFVRLLTTRYADSGFVHLSALMLDDRIVATHWGLVYKKRLYYLLPSYERGEITRYSPGNILLHHLFEWCFENGLTLADFTVGDEPYKLQWRDTELRLFEYRKANTLKGHASVLPSAIRSQAKRTIKRSPALLNTLYVLRSHKARLARRFFTNREES